MATTKAARAVEAVIRAYKEAMADGANSASALGRACEAYRSIHPRISGDVVVRVVKAIIWSQERT